MSVGEAVGRLKDDGRPPFEKYVAIYIAVVAVLLSIATVSGDNAAKDAAKANLDAANLWAFFQAKNLRRTQYALMADQLELQRLGEPPPALKAAIDAKLADYRDRIAKFTSDKERQEGLDELFVRAKSLESARDVAMRRDPYFDYAQALLQIAIVLGSVAIITGGTLSLYISVILAALGTASLVNGHMLVVEIEPALLQTIEQIASQLMSNARPK